MPFFGPVSLGGGDPSASGGTYDELLARLMQEFPGLSNLSQGGPIGNTTGSLGFSWPGSDLYSGQPISGGGLYGSTGTGIFEGASSGQAGEHHRRLVLGLSRSVPEPGAPIQHGPARDLGYGLSHGATRQLEWRSRGGQFQQSQ